MMDRKVICDLHLISVSILDGRKNVNREIHFASPFAMQTVRPQERLTCTKMRLSIFPLSWRRSRPSFAPPLLQIKIPTKALPEGAFREAAMVWVRSLPNAIRRRR
jgi:hypothetical protein